MLKYWYYITEWIATPTGSVLFAIVFYTAIVFVGWKILTSVTNRFTHVSGASALYWKFIKQILRVSLILVGIFGVISKLPDMDKLGTTLIASSSLVVAAVGLASQESLANAINGMMITIFKPFVVGDRVRLNTSGLSGFIEDINLRHTVIRTYESNRIFIPNTTMNKENIENFNHTDGKVCNFLDFTVTYESDLQVAKQLIVDAVLGHPSHVDARSAKEILEDKPVANVLIRELRPTGITLRVGVWAQDISGSFQMCSDIRETVFNTFKTKGVELYRPKLEIKKG